LIVGVLVADKTSVNDLQLTCLRIYFILISTGDLRGFGRGFKAVFFAENRDNLGCYAKVNRINTMLPLMLVISTAGGAEDVFSTYSPAGEMKDG
jgi:hypothetical protein